MVRNPLWRVVCHIYQVIVAQSWQGQTAAQIVIVGKKKEKKKLSVQRVSRIIVALHCIACGTSEYEKAKFFIGAGKWGMFFDNKGPHSSMFRVQMLFWKLSKKKMSINRDNYMVGRNGSMWNISMIRLYIQ